VFSEVRSAEQESVLVGPCSRWCGHPCTSGVESCSRWCVHPCTDCARQSSSDVREEASRNACECL